MYCCNWGSASNSDKRYQWRRFIQTPAWNFLIFAANLLSSRWLGSLRWMLIARGPKRIVSPGWRPVMNTVIWRHMPCSTALCSVPGWRSVCRQCWMFPVSETLGRREWRVPLVVRWTLIHINRFSLSLSHTHTAFLSPIIYLLKDVHYTSHSGRKRKLLPTCSHQTCLLVQLFARLGRCSLALKGHQRGRRLHHPVTARAEEGRIVTGIS